MAVSTIKKDNPITQGTGTVYQSRVTDANVKWIKVGRVVYIGGYLRTTSTVSTGTALMTGFPVPLDLSGPVAQMLNTSASGNVPMEINFNGALCIGGFRSPAADTNYSIQGMYISAT